MSEKIIKTNVDRIGDPVILLEDDVYYMYATYEGGKPFHVYTSTDCKTFEDKGVCLSMEHCFAYTDIWAPEVFKYNGVYYMIYSGRWHDDELLHVQIAASDNPLGPFKDLVEKPLIQIPGLSTIDGHVYIENDEKYLFYSLDCSTNIINGVHTSQIYCVKMADDFKSVVGEHVFISGPTSDFEKLSGPEWQWNEGPFVLKNNGKYFMTVSTNCYNSKWYSMVCYVSDNIMGPYVKQEEDFLVSYIENVISGPGHNSFFVDKDGKLKCVYHVHTYYDAPSDIRTACISDAYFTEDNKLVIDYK